MMATHDQKSITAVKGHLVTKSSALATDSCKLERQFIVAQNMASHYKRVLNAKPTLDLSPPKSLLSSQKARDRAKREMARSSIVGRSTERPYSADSFKDIFEERATEVKDKNASSNKQQRKMSARTLPDQLKLNKSMSNMMANFTKKSASARVPVYKPSSSRNSLNFDQNQENSAPLASSRQSAREQRVKNTLSNLSFSSINNKNSSPLLAHPALKAMSRLAGGHNYDVLDNHADKFKKPEEEFQPRIVNKENAQSKLLTNSNFYQPPLRRKKPKTPREQNSATTQNNFEDEQKEQKEDKTRLNESQNQESKSKETSFHDAQASDINRSLYDSAINESRKEEDIKYLGFIKEVTDDVINRGICSNRVINNCFEYHINKNRGVLNEKKMRDLLETLRKDIGIPNKDDIETRSQVTRNLYDSDYLTLKKLGWSSRRDNNSKHTFATKNIGDDQNISNNSRAWKMIDDGIDDQRSDYIFDSTKPHSNESILEEYGNKIKENVENIQSLRRKSTEDSQLFENSPRKMSSQEQFSPTKKNESILKNTDSTMKSRGFFDFGENHSDDEANSDDDNMIIVSNHRKQSKNSDKIESSESIANKSTLSNNNSPQPRINSNQKRVSIEKYENEEWIKDDESNSGEHNSSDDESEYEDNRRHSLDKNKKSEGTSQHRKLSQTNQSHEGEDDDRPLERTPPRPAPRKFDADINLKNPYISDDED